MNSRKPVAKPDDPETPERLQDHIASNPGGAVAGAASAAVAGGVIGAGAGPAGMAAGVVAGAVAGAIGGSGARGSREVTVEREDTHWREHYAAEPYVGPGASYEDYGPAYRHAASLWLAHDGRRSWDDAQAELEATWGAQREGSSLAWADALPAVRAAWQRLDEVARPSEGDQDA